MSKIVKPNPTLNKSSISKPLFQNKENYVNFSFKALDFTEYFNLDGTCQNWSFELFNMMKDISQITIDRLFYSREYKTYRIHTHDNAKPPSDLPNGVDLKSLMQIRLGKSKGAIHGTLIENTFYIVWLDPLHNLYPSAQHGGLRKIKPPSTCCKERDIELENLKDENEQLKKDNKDWEDMINNS